jgi:hypothetical protein
LKITVVLACLLIASAISIGVGGAFLLDYNLVPQYLVELTAVATLVLLVLAIFVRRANFWAINISTALGVIAPLLSLSTPDHIGVLLSLGQGLLISLLGMLQILGFFVFPIAFVIIRLVFWKRVSSARKGLQN